MSWRPLSKLLLQRNVCKTRDCGKMKDRSTTPSAKIIISTKEKLAAKLEPVYRAAIRLRQLTHPTLTAIPVPDKVQTIALHDILYQYILAFCHRPVLPCENGNIQRMS
jgi:hypothetical protein